ncbi:MAG: hypothetical protein COA66_00475 [Arcobacter sp.]|nr:MAG: hypothetical protein COA66_00475 [Arcobacter sp.]
MQLYFFLMSCILVAVVFTVHAFLDGSRITEPRNNEYEFPTSPKFLAYFYWNCTFLFILSISAYLYLIFH